MTYLKRDSISFDNGTAAECPELAASLRVGALIGFAVGLVEGFCIFVNDWFSTAGMAVGIVTIGTFIVVSLLALVSTIDGEYGSEFPARFWARTLCALLAGCVIGLVAGVYYIHG